MFLPMAIFQAVLTESPLEEPKTQTTSSEEEAEPEWFRDIKRQDEDTGMSSQQSDNLVSSMNLKI